MFDTIVKGLLIAGLVVGIVLVMAYGAKNGYEGPPGNND